MGHTSSSKKRSRQYLEQRTRNNAAKTLIKSKSRKLTAAVAAKDAESLKKAYSELCSSLDKAVKKGNLKKQTAIRRKARAAKTMRAAIKA